MIQRYFAFYSPGLVARASLNTVLLRRGRDVFLVDTGTGPATSQPNAPPTGLLASRLSFVGVASESVTGVFLTHAHTDHAGGLLTATGGAAFPNARVYLGVMEDKFWQLTRAAISEQAPQLPLDFLNATLNMYAAIRKAYQGKIRKLNDLESPIRGVQAWATPGHTPGHMAYQITSGRKSFVIVGDVLLARVITIQNPDWNIFSDTNRTQAVHTSIDLMETLATSKTLAMLYHEALPGLGYVVRDRAMFDFSIVARVGNISW